MILTEQNYHSPEANITYMSASQFKSFQRCEAAALEESMGRWTPEPTTALLVGSYVDAHFSQTLDLFKAQNPAIFKRDGGLKAEFQQAEEIIARIERDLVFMEHLDGERQAIFTGAIGGVAFRAKPDFMRDGKIVDLKIMRDFAPVWSAEEGRRVPFVEAWGYDLQGAIYQEIVRQNIGKRLPFIIAAATKESVPDIGLFSIPQARLNYCLDLVEHMAPEFNAMKLGLDWPDRCEKCDFCKATKRLDGPVDYDAITV